MNNEQEWDKEPSQHGLFTLFFEHKMLTPVPQTTTEPPRDKLLKRRQFKSEKKITAKYRVKSRYHNLNNTISSVKDEKQIQLPSRMIHFQKIKYKSNISSPQFTAKNCSRPMMGKHRSLVKLKINNISQHCDFDDARKKEKMFAFWGEPGAYVRTCIERNQAPVRKDHPLVPKEKGRKCLRLEAGRAIDSEGVIKRTPFLQFLIKQVGSQAVEAQARHYKEYRKERHKLTLSHLITHNNPGQKRYKNRVNTER